MDEDIYPLPLDREKCTFIYDHSIHSHVIFVVKIKNKRYVKIKFKKNNGWRRDCGVYNTEKLQFALYWNFY